MNIHDFTVKNNRGEDQSLSEYKGKVLLVVNTATKCGLTPQYSELQAIYNKYKEKGFVVLDFPCNQFLSQAPGSNEEINEFCSVNYSTEFPRFSKIDVNGKNISPLYKWLKEQAPKDITDEESEKFEKKVKPLTLGNSKEDIKWNFGKFLIDQNGDVVGRYSPAISPEKLEKEIERLVG